MKAFLAVAVVTWVAFGIFAARSVSEGIEDAARKRQAVVESVVRS